MKLSPTLLAACVIACFQGPNANAAIFDWSYSGQGVSGSGTLTVDGGYVDAITGTANGLSIVGLHPYGGASQRFSDSVPHVDSPGLGFIATNGEAFNIYANYYSTVGFYCGVSIYCLEGPGIPPYDDNPRFNSIVPITFAAFEPTVSQTPLPAALPLFATGLGVMGLLGWRRKRSARHTIGLGLEAPCAGANRVF
jgi:hypothetical protein